ncbi:MAG: hypothetical protein WBD74_09460, partial [Candidatus Aquilonibacter sp.]
MRARQSFWLVASVAIAAALCYIATPSAATAQSCTLSTPGSSFVINCSNLHTPVPFPTTAPLPQLAPYALNTSGPGGSGGDDGALFVSSTSGSPGGNGNLISGIFGTSGTSIYSTGTFTPGIFLISNGGGGGNGGSGYLGASGSGGGNGGNGGNIFATTTGAVITNGLFAPGVYALSAGGVGGSGGSAYVTFGGGGNGAPGGSGGTISLFDSGNIYTFGYESFGLW